MIKHQDRTGGRIIADALASLGIEHVFSVAGESFLGVLDGLHDLTDRINLVTCRFEAGAVHMAEAYGKLAGKPAAAIVTRGPGACHAAIGVHVAFQDSTPLLLLVGQVPSNEVDREGFQEVDYRSMFSPLAKWVTQIDDVARAPELLAHALDVAKSGRPGPVVVALPENMQRAHAEIPNFVPTPMYPARPNKEGLGQMRELLADARKPLAIVGGGAGWTETGKAALRAFLTASNIPVCVAFRRQSTYDGTLSNFVGDIGIGADPALFKAVREADLVLAIGTRLNDTVTQGYTLFEPSGRTPIVHVYPEQAEIGRVFRVKLGIHSDLNTFAQEAAGLEPVPSQWDDWTTRLRDLRMAGLDVPNYPVSLNLAQVMRELDEELAADAIVTTDAGNFSTWAPRFINFRAGQHFVGPVNGAMGYAVPAAVGAKIAFPGRMTVALVGDGGCLMTGQEIATAFHHGATPIVIVFNNGMYGTIRMHQEIAFPKRVSGTELTNPDFAKWIESFGGHGETVSETAQFLPAFRRAAASGKPAVIELKTDPEQITSRTTISALRAVS